MSARLPANADRGSTWSAPALRAALMRSIWTCDAKPIALTPFSSGSALSAAIVAMGSAFALLRSMMMSEGFSSRACARICSGVCAKRTSALTCFAVARILERKRKRRDHRK